MDSKPLKKEEKKNQLEKPEELCPDLLNREVRESHEDLALAGSVAGRRGRFLNPRPS